MTGPELRSKRLALGLQQQEVAATMNRSSALLSLVERERIPMSRDFEARYLQALARQTRTRTK